MRLRAIVAALAIASAVAEASAAPAYRAPVVPALPGTVFPPKADWVVDAAHLLTPKQTRALRAKLIAFERRTRHQFIVVTVKSLGGNSIESYSLTLFNTWGVGRRDIGDGVMILVAQAERRARIEVGYGLETPLTDARAARIMANEMVPAFTKGRFAAGIDRAADAIIALLERTGT